METFPCPVILDIRNESIDHSLVVFLECSDKLICVDACKLRFFFFLADLEWTLLWVMNAGGLAVLTEK